MYYNTIKNCDIANGIGIRVSLFVSGCTNHCENCFQPETWDFEYGQPFNEDTEKYIIDLMKPSYINGLTLLGGEPMEPKNQECLLPFIKKIKYIYPEKNIWCYSGFVFEDLMKEGTYCHTKYTEELLRNIDVLVDGRFVEKLKKLTLKFRGSSNQRLIDLSKTFEEGNITLLPIEDRDLKI